MRFDAGHLASLLLCALCLACTPPRVERVVLVSIDTLRADHVGAYGASFTTPRLDAVAREGARFATAIAPTPITLPSHTSLLTALDPPRHGVRDNSTFRLASDLPTLPEQMKRAGFATAAFVGAMVLDRQYGLGRGFDVYDDRMSPRLAALAEGFPERTADRVIDAALAWLAIAPDRFFLWVHLYDPHSGYRAPARFRADAPSPYAAEVRFVDRELGRLLDALEARSDTTLWVITSDHGESLGEHGEPTHSLSIYDATQHVPLLLRGPGVPRGSVVETPVRLIDVAPTILALADVAPLADAEGRDLRAVMQGSNEPVPLAYLETLATQIDLGWSPLLGVRSAEYKYISAPRPELYALKSDPQERHDLHSELPEVAARLDAQLQRRLRGARPVIPNLQPDAESRALLESLGYVAVAPPGGVRFGLGRVGGTDPKDGMAQLEALNQAWQQAVRGGASEGLERLATVEGGGFFRAQLGAEAALEIGDAEAALRFARLAVREAPQFWESHTTLGRALLLAQQIDAAEQAFSAAVTLDGAVADPLVGLARVAEAHGKLEKARRLYGLAIERRGNSAEAHWRLAALELEAGRDAAARELLARISPDLLETPSAALRLARAEHRSSRLDAARARLDAALARRPEHAALRQARLDLESAGR